MGQLGDAIGKALPAGAGTEAQLAHLTKVVHVLWKEVERLERIVQVIPEGLRIKTGMSEVLVLQNGGIILNGMRIEFKTPGQSQLLL